MRWRIERDYSELKQEVGLGHYEGRSWRGFHHHASLCIAAYGFLMRERLRGVKKTRSTQSASRTRSLPPARVLPRCSGTSRGRLPPCAFVWLWPSLDISRNVRVVANRSCGYLEINNTVQLRKLWLINFSRESSDTT